MNFKGILFLVIFQMLSTNAMADYNFEDLLDKEFRIECIGANTYGTTPFTFARTSTNPKILSFSEGKMSKKSTHQLKGYHLTVIETDTLQGLSLQFFSMNGDRAGYNQYKLIVFNDTSGILYNVLYEDSKKQAIGNTRKISLSSCKNVRI